MRIGVLIPEFPGQTHIFFWRELQELRTLGIESEVASTRRPVEDIICHVWSQQALAETLYLSPPSLRLLFGGMYRLLMAGPASWGRAMKAVKRADGITAGDMPRMVALAFVGAALAGEARWRGWSHLHAHSAADSALLAMFCRMFGGPPYSLTLHGDISGYGAAQNIKWENASFGITVNSALQQAVLAKAPGLSPDRLSVAPMGVDVTKFRRSGSYEPPAREERLRIVTCGRLHSGKAHADIIRAVAMLRTRGFPASLVILGEGPDREALESLRTELGVADCVQLAGAVPEDVVRRHLEGAHVFVLASLNEALGVATMEAMAMEVPVIVTDVGGVSELVRDRADGILVPPSDPEAITAAVERLVENRDLARYLSAAGRRRIVEGFTSAESAKLLARLLVAPRLGVSQEVAACAS